MPAARRPRGPPRRPPPRALPHVHRGAHRELGRRARARRPLGGGDPAHPPAARVRARRVGGDDGSPRPHAPHRCAPRAAPTRRALSCRSTSRTARFGTGRMIEEGVALVTEVLDRAPIGPYQLQAAIAAVHDEAASTDETDWIEILGLYDLLERMAPGPMVTLGRIVALAMVEGPEAGLAALERAEASGTGAGPHRASPHLGGARPPARAGRGDGCRIPRLRRGSAPHAQRARTALSRGEGRDPARRTLTGAHALMRRRAPRRAHPQRSSTSSATSTSSPAPMPSAVRTAFFTGST